jgi:hypothetical protein
MYERMKAFLRRCLDIVVALVLVALLGAYVIINSIMMTHVINNIQLDAYVTYGTGFGVVMLILLLGWAPAWLKRSLQDKR